MSIPVEDSIQNGNTINDEYFEAIKRNRHPEKYQKNKSMKLNDSKMNKNSTAEGNSENIDGIKLDYFSNNCAFLYGIHDEVKTRLFKALGIDIESKNNAIKWEQFVELY